jgi:hypothetical protein
MHPTNTDELIASLKILREAVLKWPGILGQRTAAILETAGIRAVAADKIEKNLHRAQAWTPTGA